MGCVRIFLEKILAVDFIASRIILNGYRGIMYKKVSMTLIMASAIVAILTVPWAALQRSYAQSDFVDTILKVHNDERAAVGKGVPDLVWSSSLAADAKTWADHLVTLNQGKPIDKLTASDLVHSTGTGYGENLHQSGEWGTLPISQPSTKSLLQGWVAEKNNYKGGPLSEADFRPGAPVIGHYTQMVWKNTKEVGCATAIAKGKASNGDPAQAVYLVCRYSPQGNYYGQTPY